VVLEKRIDDEVEDAPAQGGSPAARRAQAGLAPPPEEDGSGACERVRR
jgi:hypothetical protein